MKVTARTMKKVLKINQEQQTKNKYLIIISPRYGHFRFDGDNIALSLILKRTLNITFARGGSHLPIAHALRLAEKEIISWGGIFLGAGDFFGSRGFLGFFWGWGIFFG